MISNNRAWDAQPDSPILTDRSLQQLSILERRLKMNEPQIKLAEEQQQPSLQQRIMQGLDAQGVSYGEEAIDKLVEYLHLLQEWNKTHNLTAVDDIDEMLSVHIFDSASIKPYIKGSTLLDVGSGAGLPGMILAILSPALQVTSVESRNKKAQFQMYVANRLKLKNFTVKNEPRGSTRGRHRCRSKGSCRWSRCTARIDARSRRGIGTGSRSAT